MLLGQKYIRGLDVRDVKILDCGKRDCVKRRFISR
jgi:hypothetical protein